MSGLDLKRSVSNIQLIVVSMRQVPTLHTITLLRTEDCLLNFPVKKDKGCSWGSKAFPNGNAFTTCCWRVVRKECEIIHTDTKMRKITFCAQLSKV